jgi:hypothetical protein
MTTRRDVPASSSARAPCPDGADQARAQGRVHGPASRPGCAQQDEPGAPALAMTDDAPRRTVAEWLPVVTRRNEQPPIGAEGRRVADIFAATGVDREVIEQFREDWPDPVVATDNAVAVITEMAAIERAQMLRINDLDRAASRSLQISGNPDDALDTIRELVKRGIDPAVWDARGCRRYQQGDDWVKEEFRPFLPKSKLGTVTLVVNQCAGWLMPKHAPPGFPPIPPQLRPDRSVILNRSTTWHHHGPWSIKPWPTFPEAAGAAAGENLPLSLVMFEDAASAHVNKTSTRDYDPATGEGTHNGKPVHVVHQHAPHEAKYVLLGGEGACARIDLHPLALRRLPDTEVVFFVLEGTPKTDAVLSAGEVAFGVPSVTCWDAAELARFADLYLQGKKVAVVPDADWSTNPQVERQALKVRTLLRRHRIVAEVAAPPHDADPFYKGVDDHLAAGRTLGDLVFEGREAPMDLIRESVRHVGYQRRKSAQEALEDLSLYAPGGVVANRSFLNVRALLGIRQSIRVVPLLESIGFAFTVTHGSLDTVQYPIPWSKYTWTGWRDRPTIELREEFRSR